MPNKKTSRRTFLQSTAKTAGLAMTASLWPRKANARIIGANDKINLGMIGVGGRGGALVDEFLRLGERCKIVAVCDVWERRKNEEAQKCDAAGYTDYHEVLMRSDIDAVVVATPDHWHAKISIDAMEAGKDVYCEKPMTKTIEEAKKVYEASEKLKRIIQVGSQYASMDMNWQARKIIEEGRIGKQVWSQGTYCRNSREWEWNWPMDMNAGPDKGGDDHIDWKMWLGASPNVDYDPERYFRFRKYWDYSGGIATDLFYHKLAALTVCSGDEFPYRVTGTGGIWVQSDSREVPDTFFTNIDYPSNRSVIMPSSMASNIGLPTIIRGNCGTIYCDDPEPNHLRVVADEPFGAEFEKLNGSKEFVVKPEKREGHQANFLTCVQTREQPHLNALRGYIVMVPIAMSVEAYRRNEVLFFNEKNHRVTSKAFKLKS
ncbi:MAG: Gfo/Idh/MocA family oxidoreductase [Candidatus Omnitrophota bacterium]